MLVVIVAVETHWNGVPAYLLMCRKPGVQVVCVTYSLDGREVGERVMLGGGYTGSRDGIILLDPCLASTI